MADLHIWATYLIIVLSVVAYASERFALEMVALASLAAFLALFAVFPYEGPSGPLHPEALLSGFANPALATVMGLLIVGQGLFATDAMDRPVRMIARVAGGSSTRAMAITLLSAATLSAFLNNTPVVVIFIPILTMLAAQRNFAASKALMPLSFLTILGGMTTLIGSSTNLLVAGVAARSSINIGFFDITIPGLFLAAAGAVYVLFVMPRILRDKTTQRSFRQSQSGTQFIGEIRLGPRHPFLGIESRAGLFPGLGELTPRLIIRRGISFFPPFENVVLSEGDCLVVTATRRVFMQTLARASGGLIASDSETPPPGNPLQPLGPDYHVAEAVIPPGSRHAGRTVRNAGIETTHGVHMLGVQRKSRMGRLAMSDIRLEPGDTILVGGTDKAFEDLRESHDLLVLEWSAEAVPQRRKAGIAFAIFAAIVLTAAFNILPIVATSIIGAFAMIATGCLTLPQAGRSFDRQIFLLVGSSIAAATALERTGGAQLIADGAVALLNGQSTAVILSGYFAVVAILTNFLSNNATAVLFTPIAIGIASASGAPAEAFVTATIFAANCSFATPIGYQTNLMVMGPGHYSFADFIKAGIPLVAIIWLTFSIVGPWYYGL
ncbi:Di- and tricarboxylate transporters [Mesorhizobium sp. J18]|uniref:SLC13 family permease n=1 Tax=Mesorhizobium sp. J18 TaxID=935263 RepID=UPI0011999780|nr:SLC13 family permease [Mesorhizobium sp. J18]TWH01295.1 Di- and tricarboxylate transporters [Mesorhizobium sp. J18]